MTGPALHEPLDCEVDQVIPKVALLRHSSTYSIEHVAAGEDSDQPLAVRRSGSRRYARVASEALHRQRTPRRERAPGRRVSSRPRPGWFAGSLPDLRTRCPHGSGDSNTDGNTSRRSRSVTMPTRRPSTTTGSSLKRCFLHHLSGVPGGVLRPHRSHGVLYPRFDPHDPFGTAKTVPGAQRAKTSDREPTDSHLCE